jgi:hypothetical protein
MPFVTVPNYLPSVVSVVRRRIGTRPISRILGLLIIPFSFLLFMHLVTFLSGKLFIVNMGKLSILFSRASTLCSYDSSHQMKQLFRFNSYQSQPLDCYFPWPDAWIPVAFHSVTQSLFVILQLPFWVPFVGLSCLAVYLFTTTSRRPNVLQCLTCAYDLRGNIAGTCPERGTTIPNLQQEFIHENDSSHRNSSHENTEKS